MQDNWVKDSKDSISAFNAIEKSVIPMLLSGQLVNIEQRPDEVLLWLDLNAGIDFVRKNEKGIQGVAWRAQWGRNFDTFTIRSKRDSGARTELEKRIEAIKEGYFYPAFTMQAYFDNRQNNNCISCAIIKTTDLYQAYIDSPGIFKKRKSNNEFYFADWSDLPGLVKIWRNGYTVMKDKKQFAKQIEIAF